MGLIDQTSDTACVSFYKRGYIGAARLAPMQINQNREENRWRADSGFHPSKNWLDNNLHRFRNRERSCLFDCVWQNQSRVIRYESIQSKCTFEAFNSFSIFPLFLDEIYRGLSSRLRFVMEKLAKFEEKKDCTQSFLLELRHICSRMLFPSSLSLSLTSSLPFSIPNPSNKRHPRY